MAFSLTGVINGIWLLCPLTLTKSTLQTECKHAHRRGFYNDLATFSVTIVEKSYHFVQYY